MLLDRRLELVDSRHHTIAGVVRRRESRRLSNRRIDSAGRALPVYRGCGPLRRPQLADDFFACEEIVSELRTAQGAAASVYGKSAAGAVDPAVRKATRLAAPDDTRNRVMARIDELKPAIEQHFNVALNEIENPQFLRYVTGDYFVAHQDGNTPLLRDDSRFRKISVIVFLSDPSAYDGGSLLVH